MGQNTLQFPDEIPVTSHYRLWSLLGEVSAQLREVQAAVLPPQVAVEVEETYLRRGAAAIYAASGNQLSENEIDDIASCGEEGRLGESARESEIWNVLQACHGLVRATRKETPPKLNTDYLGRINATVLAGLELPAGETAGEVRRGERGGMGVPAAECRLCLERYCDWLASGTFAVQRDELLLVIGILRAMMAQVYLLRISPYADANARTARLTELYLLLRAGVPAPAAMLTAVHYAATRSRFLEELAALDVPEGTVLMDSYFIYALQGWADALRGLLADLRERSLCAVWRLHVQDVFRSASTEKTATRRRDLLLSLPAHPTPIAKFADIPQGVFYTHYRHKNLRTLTRDLTELVQMGLLESTRAGFRPRMETLRPWEKR